MIFGLIRRFRWVLLSLFVLLLLGAVVGHRPAKATTATSPTPAWVTLNGRTVCWPIAESTSAQQQGLQGVRFVRYPLVFSFQPARVVGFWMKNTPTALTGVWVGSNNRVVGYWHGVRETLAAHYPKQAVSYVIEYPTRWKVPPLGSLLIVKGSCGPLVSL